MASPENFSSPITPSLHEEKAPTSPSDELEVTRYREKMQELNRQSRRTFLKGVGATAVSGASLAVFPTIRDEVKEKISSEQLAETIDTEVQQIFRTYGVHVSFGELPDKPDIFTSEELRLAAKERGVLLLKQELGKLPPMMIKESLLKLITLRAEIQTKASQDKNRLLNTELIGGYVTYKGKEPRAMQLNIGGGPANAFNLFGWTEGGARTTFSHELFHAVDEVDPEAWYALYEAAALQKAYAQDDRTKNLILNIAGEKTLGFARFYGRMNHKEDRATIYEGLSDIESYKELLEQSLGDHLLYKKILFIEIDTILR